MLGPQVRSIRMLPISALPIPAQFDPLSRPAQQTIATRLPRLARVGNSQRNSLRTGYGSGWPVQTAQSSGSQLAARPALEAMLADKHVIQGLLHARSTLGKPGGETSTSPQILLALRDAKAIGGIDLRAERIQRLFVDEDHAVLVRTLTRGDSQLQGTGSGVNPPVSRTPGKVERNTLNNRMRSFEILFTPATLIDPDLHVASIAHHPHRPRWSAMPSVLYSSPFRSGVDVLGPLDGLKACFGKNSSHGGSPAWQRNRVSRASVVRGGNAPQHAPAVQSRRGRRCRSVTPSVPVTCQNGEECVKKRPRHGRCAGAFRPLSTRTTTTNSPMECLAR